MGEVVHSGPRPDPGCVAPTPSKADSLHGKAIAVDRGLPNKRDYSTSGPEIGRLGYFRSRRVKQSLKLGVDGVIRVCPQGRRMTSWTLSCSSEADYRRAEHLTLRMHAGIRLAIAESSLESDRSVGKFDSRRLRYPIDPSYVFDSISCADLSTILASCLYQFGLPPRQGEQHDHVTSS